MKDNLEEIWYKPVKKIGMATLITAVIGSFGPLLYLYFTRGVYPPLDAALSAWALVAASFGAAYFVEPISYYAILGLAGTYVSFLSGNISNLRLPASAMAQEVLEVEEGSKKAEIIGTLGIIGSVITNLIGVTLAAFIGMRLIEVFPPIVVDAFRDYTAPAIFGAVFGQFTMKYPKLAPFGIGIPLILLGVFDAPLWLVILGAVFGTILVARVFYQKGLIE
ncbi:hypothetical protein MWH28_10735 [Natroniella sulfidigena]|uniref:hypothetical protein n=1 Tax=Natroniella sulfidigena TaxID=723921 RepID=UPI00200AB86E|nr:hypothetical protein [Natroniella sulfidigena]MCK8817838.1 hypothetical protein [Natroniella sulfidigena]